MAVITPVIGASANGTLNTSGTKKTYTVTAAKEATLKYTVCNTDTSTIYYFSQSLTIGGTEVMQYNAYPIPPKGTLEVVGLLLPAGTVISFWADTNAKLALVMTGSED